MQPLLTEEAIEYRQRLQRKFQTFLSKQKSSSWQDMKRRLIPVDDFFSPISHIPPDNLAIDVLCALIEVHGTTMAILHSRSKIEGPEGVGRTSLLLKLLGVYINYAQIKPDPKKIYSHGPISIHRTLQKDIKLLTADFAYIANLNEQLFVFPVTSEPILGLWDIARHIYRMIEEDYRPGMRLTAKGKEILDALMNVIPIPIIEYYGKWEEPHTINIAVILEISSAVSSPTLTSISEYEESRNALHRAFDSVCYLKTPFWMRNPVTHSQLVKRILESVIRLPKVYLISIPMNILHLHDKEKYSDELFKQFNYILKSDCGGFSDNYGVEH